MNDEVQVPVVESPAVTEVTLPKPDDLVAQNNALRAEVEELKRDAIAAKVTAENKASDTRIKAFVAAAHKPAVPLQSGRDAVARNRAIAQVGGLAPWMRQPASDRCEVLGVPDSVSVKDSTLKSYFGAKSDSRAAAELADSRPAEYRRLKIIAIERGLY